MATLEQGPIEPGLTVPAEAYADEPGAQPNGHDKSAKAVVLRHIRLNHSVVARGSVSVGS